MGSDLCFRARRTTYTAPKPSSATAIAKGSIALLGATKMIARRRLSALAAAAVSSPSAQANTGAATLATGGRHLIRFEDAVCGSIEAFSARLGEGARVAALDLSDAHVSVAVSTRDRTEAAPFGVLARSNTVEQDGRLLARAFRHTSYTEPAEPLDVEGLVVGLAPPSVSDNKDSHEAVFDYVRGLLDYGRSDPEIHVPLPGLQAVLFYSEAEALRRSIQALEDYAAGIAALPGSLERSRPRAKFEALYPTLSADDLKIDHAARARLSASELLQAALDDMERVKRRNTG